eukprot:11089061-Alexandrium_andersonii.AAC.1
MTRLEKVSLVASDGRSNNRTERLTKLMDQSMDARRGHLGTLAYPGVRPQLKEHQQKHPRKPLVRSPPD